MNQLLIAGAPAWEHKCPSYPGMVLTPKGQKCGTCGAADGAGPSARKQNEEGRNAIMGKTAEQFNAWLDSRPDDGALPWRRAMSQPVQKGAEYGWKAGAAWALREALRSCYAEAEIALEGRETADDCAKAIEILLRDAES